MEMRSRGYVISGMLIKVSEILALIGISCLVGIGMVEIAWIMAREFPYRFAELAVVFSILICICLMSKYIRQSFVYVFATNQDPEGFADFMEASGLTNTYTILVKEPDMMLFTINACARRMMKQPDFTPAMNKLINSIRNGDWDNFKATYTAKMYDDKDPEILIEKL